MGRARSYTTTQLIVCGAIGAGVGLAVGGAWATKGELSHSHVEAQRAAGAYERSGRIEANHNCGYLVGPDKAYCVDRAFGRARDQERQEYELEAERDQAIWAGTAGESAIYGLAFSVFTIVALALTILQQQRTARHQQRATRISLLGLLDARRRAQQTFAHAQWVSHQELRPYVFVDKITPELVSERMYRVTVTYKNFGRTPARNLQAIVTTYLTRDLAKLRKHRPIADAISLGTVAPDGCRHTLTPLTFGKKQWEAPAYNRCCGVLRLKFTYTDETGEVRFEEAIDYYTDPFTLVRDEPPHFYLLDHAIKKTLRSRGRQPDLVTLMKTSGLPNPPAARKKKRAADKKAKKPTQPK